MNMRMARQFLMLVFFLGILGCASTLTKNASLDREPFWMKGAASWTRKAGLAELEKLPVIESHLRIWFINTLFEKDTFGLDLGPDQTSLVQPFKLIGKKRSIQPKPGQSNFWKMVDSSKIWSIPNEEELAHPVMMMDGMWVVIERKQGAHLSRIAYNNPYAGKSPEHCILNHFLDMILEQLPPTPQ